MLIQIFKEASVMSRCYDSRAFTIVCFPFFFVTFVSFIRMLTQDVIFPLAGSYNEKLITNRSVCSFLTFKFFTLLKFEIPLWIEICYEEIKHFPLNEKCTTSFYFPFRAWNAPFDVPRFLPGVFSLVELYTCFYSSMKHWFFSLISRLVRSIDLEVKYSKGITWGSGQ